ncbi:uncharacterized protein LOC125944856 isoform X2 [Dermacentor silvarum]|uniref:uncharacterized protein LOC125944856 isoform X2 n=1 Tax=Dermacentor silvarum TaxID=543639 RepID=UPI002101414E|nr:uncharacterized protein LOC125944856 isoform X2 [Dermacentor silvarum]
MSEAHGYCRCCSRWFKKHAEFQKWDAEKSLLVHKILQLGQENEKLKAKIYERTIASSQELQRRYKQQLSTTLAELKSLQQATLRQYEAFVQHLQDEARGRDRPSASTSCK